jgi:hypothetical protein
VATLQLSCVAGILLASSGATQPDGVRAQTRVFKPETQAEEAKSEQE